MNFLEVPNNHYNLFSVFCKWLNRFFLKKADKSSDFSPEKPAKSGNPLDFSQNFIYNGD